MCYYMTRFLAYPRAYRWGWDDSNLGVHNLSRKCGQEAGAIFRLLGKVHYSALFVSPSLQNPEHCHTFGSQFPLEYILVSGPTELRSR